MVFDNNAVYLHKGTYPYWEESAYVREETVKMRSLELIAKNLKLKLKKILLYLFWQIRYNVRV